MKQTLLVVLMIFLGLSSFSQKKELIEDKDLIIERATAELDSAMTGPEGKLYEYAQKNPIKGEYVFDISIWEKGTVTSIYVAGNNNGTIDAQNRLKSFMMDYTFGFKMPKGKSYKFRYTFVFE